MDEPYRNSFWESTSLLRPVGITVIGGGLTGLQTAIAIKTLRPELDVLLLERAPFSRGASTRNAGFACFGSPTELLEDLENGDETTVWDTVSRRYAGIRKLEEKYGAHCDYHQYGGYELFYEKSTAYQKVLAALPALNESFSRTTGAGPAWKIVHSAPGIADDCRLVYCTLEGQLHPGKLVEHLMQRADRLGVRSLYGMAVASINGEVGRYELSFTDQSATLITQEVIVATNAFTKALLPDLTIQAVRNQVIITKPIPRLQLRGCFHYDRGYVYFRNIGPDRLLIGGARNQAGKISETTEFGSNEKIDALLLSYLQRALPSTIREQVEVDRRWSGIIAQGGKSPIVSRLENGLIVAARLSGMGVALSAQVAEEAALLALS
ncbi:FAD-dependent oxidoreductase [Lewinellaceae bacterium SD302]|nr:FAD-dependent oxidoreductase [Lewinellaceae bacterium SD302]